MNDSLEQQNATLRAEVARLKKRLAQREQAIHHLMHWMNSLQYDIFAVYQSVTWRIGYQITLWILWLTRRPEGTTAKDHIERVAESYGRWKQHYLQSLDDDSIDFPWHETHEYQHWLRQQEVFEREVLKMRVAEPLDLHSHAERGNKDNWSANARHKLWQAHSAQGWQDFKNALQTTDSDFIYIADGYQLHPNAIALVEKTLEKHPEVVIIYADEDQLDEDGQRCRPFFKPDWTPDTFYSKNYLTGLLVLRRSLVEAVADSSENFDDLLFRVIESCQPQQIVHIPRVLASRQIDAPKSNLQQRQIALQNHLQRIGEPAEVKMTETGHYQLRYRLPDELPLISAIIPTRDRLQLLQGTIKGLLEKTDYNNLEILIIDNGSREAETIAYFKQIQADPRIRIIHHDAPFNYSELNNLGVRAANGEIIALLNNDLEMIDAEWLKAMVSHALRPAIGAVGAKLLYADNTIQHAGVVVGLGGLAGHGFKLLHRHAVGYQHYPQITRNCSAVTAACLVLRREVFEQVGGFDEKNLKVSFNDVDLCLKIREQGYRIIWTPDAILYHLESASRGVDDTPAKYWRLRSEIVYMQTHWAGQLDDPCYSPNLTVEYEDYALAYPPRLDKHWMLS